MRKREQAIKETAFIISADMRYGIKPASRAASIRWLKLALLWSIRHNRNELAQIIIEYLDAELDALIATN